MRMRAYTRPVDDGNVQSACGDRRFPTCRATWVKWLVLDNLVGLVEGLQFQVAELRLVCQPYAQDVYRFKEMQLIFQVLIWP